MRINNYLLARSPGRFGDGTPVGPDGMEFRTDKGTLDREPVGEQGVATEAVGCDRRALTFSVQRVYATEAAALAGAAGLEAECPEEGAVSLGGNTLIAAATLRSVGVRVRGVNVSAVYSFEGY